MERVSWSAQFFTFAKGWRDGMINFGGKQTASVVDRFFPLSFYLSQIENPRPYTEGDRRETFL